MNTKQMLTSARLKFPTEWKRIQRKVFHSVDAHYSADIAYINQVVALAQGSGPRLISAETQVRFNSPIFFVCRELLDAAANTELPDVIDWDALRLPFPAATFIFPRGSGYFDATQTFEVAALDYCLYQPEGGVSQFLLTTLHRQASGYLTQFDAEDRHSDEFKKASLSVVFTLLFAMAARPEYIERGHQIGTHKKSTAEIWTPNVIGRKYATKHDPNAETGTHASPRMHWRRGHFRYQPCGVNRTEHKVIWIEPMLVGAKVLANAA